MKKLLLAIAMLTTFNVSACEILEGTVMRVIDGDTIQLRTKAREKNIVTVRFSRIDAPEKKQPFGKEAGDWLKEVAQGEKVSVEVESHDQYGRTVGTVMMGNENLNAMMVEDGYAWVYDEYADDVEGAALNELEQVAREKNKGLWIDANPIYPADFRKAQK